MTFSSTWTPDEDSQTLFSETCWLQSAIITAIAYGVTIPLYLSSFHRLVRGKNPTECRKRFPLLILITLSFILGTLYMITLAGFIQMMFINYRNYPGGPNAFGNNRYNVPIMYVNAVACILSNWLSDVLMIWRFKVIYQTCTVSMWIKMLFPCLLLAGKIATGVMSLFHFSTTTIYTRLLVKFAVPYLALSLTLSITLTLAIALRLLTLRHRITSLMGPNYGKQYMSVSLVMIESAALYSTVSIMVLVSTMAGNAIYHVFTQSWAQFQIIATLLTVFRVAQGKGWNQDTAIYSSSGLDPSHLEDLQLVFPENSISMENFAETRMGQTV